MVYGFLGVSVLLFLIGSEAILRGGIGLFKEVGIPTLFVGVFLAPLAMAAPELSVALQATARSAPDIALGDVIGSVLANILLVFGLGALLRPIPGSPRIVFRDGGTLLAAAILLEAFMLGGELGRIVGAVLLLAWLAYLVLFSITDWRRPPVLSASQLRTQTRSQDYGGGVSLFLFAFGIVCLTFGARFVVDCAIVIARNFHLPQASVALVMVALATSLPEFVSMVAASVRGQTGFVSSHLIASSSFSLLFALGLAALVRPLVVGASFTTVDGPILVVAAVALFGFLLSGWRLTRTQGGLLLLGYFAYLFSVALRAGIPLHR